MTTTTADDFDPEDTWDKVRRHISDLGSKAVVRLLTAWFVATDPKTPMWARTALGSALAYFAFPVDAVPDFVVGIGYSDDIAVLGLALAAVATCIRPRHRKQAREAWGGWIA